MIEKLKHNKIILFLGSLLPGLFSALIGWISIRAYEIDYRVMSVGGDGTLIAAVIKSLRENGFMGLFFNDRIGAPEVSTLIDVPFLDFAMAFQLVIVNIFVDHQATVYYVFYLLTFFTTATAMNFLFHSISKNYVFQFVFSVIFAIAPYHFYRGLGHITLSNYMAVPLGIFLAYTIYRWNEKKRTKGSIIGLFLTATFVGMGNVYYSFFSMIMMGTALILVMLKDKTLKYLWKQGFLLYNVMICFLLGVAPKVFYGIKYGSNAEAGKRLAVESEYYGMKIVQLLLPPSYSRISTLSSITSNYTTTFPGVTENLMASLGITATIGFLGLCLYFFVSYFGETDHLKNNQLLKLTSVFILILVLYSTVGGFGTIFSMFITPQIRCLNRASIFILGLSLVGIVLFMDNLQKKKYRYLAALIAFGMLLMSGYEDVLVFPSEWQKTDQMIAADYQEFFHKMEDSLDTGAMVYQLPYTDFPEVVPVHNMYDYTHLIGYLNTDDLKWSYGGVKGRNKQAKELFVDDGVTETFVQGIQQAGFEAVYIDTNAYADGGVFINSFYQETLGLEPISSEDGRLYCYILNAK